MSLPDYLNPTSPFYQQTEVGAHEPLSDDQVGSRLGAFVRDPFRTPGGFLPASDFESGGLSDPQFERHHAFVVQLENANFGMPPASPHLAWPRTLAALAMACWIVGLLFFPEELAAIIFG
ncbi:MAG TPA: hypothetical protein VF637_07835 [Sphingomicrobium sp.]|jgi:hypothetical protein